MYKKTLFRLSLLVVLGCMAVETTSLIARNRDEDEYYDDEDGRSRNSSAKKGIIGGTISGAAVGGAFGGPVGAGVGAAVGLGVGGGIGHSQDKKRERRARRRREQARNDQDDVTRLREENAALRAQKGK